MEGPKRRKRKNDRIDAHKLARVGRMDPQSLFTVDHRSADVRQDLVALRARDALVAVRTELINTTRGPVKSMGARLPKCSSGDFSKKVEGAVPLALREALMPLVRLVETLSDGIEAYDERIEKQATEKYPQTKSCRNVLIPLAKLSSPSRINHSIAAETPIPKHRTSTGYALSYLSVRS